MRSSTSLSSTSVSDCQSAGAALRFDSNGGASVSSIRVSSRVWNCSRNEPSCRCSASCAANIVLRSAAFDTDCDCAASAWHTRSATVKAVALTRFAATTNSAGRRGSEGFIVDAAYFLSASRISRSSKTSSAGGGATGAGAAATSSRFIRFTALTIMKMMNARITKLIDTVRKLP